MTSREFGIFTNPLCYTKMAVLLAPLFSVTAILTPPPPPHKWMNDVIHECSLNGFVIQFLHMLLLAFNGWYRWELNYWHTGISGHGWWPFFRCVCYSDARWGPIWSKTFWLPGHTSTRAQLRQAQLRQTWKPAKTILDRIIKECAYVL